MNIAWIKIRLKEYADLVKFEHTVFAMPFALSLMLLACPMGMFPSWLTVFWIVLAIIGGRTYAMALNRLLDASFDAKNPRTQNRGLPAGRVKPWEAWGLVILSGGLFCLATYKLPPLCTQLLPLAYIILTVYSLMKRFSAMAHLVLGLALGSASIGGWVAVTNELSLLPVLFGLAITFWVMGFDLIYACQDVDCDRSLKLHSIPAWLGISHALTISKIVHALAMICLLTFGLLYPVLKFHPLYWPFWVAVVMTLGMLIYEHRLVKADDLSRVNEAFFNVNGRISVLFFVLICLQKLLEYFEFGM